MSETVLITDGDLRVTLPVLRSLAKKGVETAVAASRTQALSFFSKYCKNTRFLYPGSRENLSRFLRAIKRISEKVSPCIIFPIGEWTLIPISTCRRDLPSNVQLPLGSHESIQTTFDKALTLKLAADVGVPIPQTFFIRSVRELKRVSEKIAYPAVIKPRTSWVWNSGKASFSRPYYAGSPGELISFYTEVHKEFPNPLVQEYIPGINYSIGVLCNRSKLRAICCISVERSEPILGGNSTFRQSVALNPRMKEYTLRLLEALDWHGVAELEFRLDPRDSIPKLMEINGRFWGSLEVAIAAGVNLPYLLYKLATDGEVEPVFNYRVGVKRRWLEGDLKHLSKVLGNNSHPANTPSPDKWNTLIEFLKIYEGGYDCFYWDDPLPFLSRFLWGEHPKTIYERLRKKLLRGFSSNSDSLN